MICTMASLITVTSKQNSSNHLHYINSYHTQEPHWRYKLTFTTRQVEVFEHTHICYSSRDSEIKLDAKYSLKVKQKVAKSGF